jgi:hypothetical protein
MTVPVIIVTAGQFALALNTYLQITEQASVKTVLTSKAPLKTLTVAQLVKKYSPPLRTQKVKYSVHNNPSVDPSTQQIAQQYAVTFSLFRFGSVQFSFIRRPLPLSFPFTSQYRPSALNAPPAPPSSMEGAFRIPWTRKKYAVLKAS